MAKYGVRPRDPLLGFHVNLRDLHDPCCSLEDHQHHTPMTGRGLSMFKRQSEKNTLSWLNGCGPAQIASSKAQPAWYADTGQVIYLLDNVPRCFFANAHHIILGFCGLLQLPILRNVQTIEECWMCKIIYICVVCICVTYVWISLQHTFYFLIFPKYHQLHPHFQWLHPVAGSILPRTSSRAFRGRRHVLRHPEKSCIPNHVISLNAVPNLALIYC